MKKQVVIGVLSMFVGSALAAGPIDEIKAAAKRLADSSGYSWKSTTESPGAGGGGGPRMGGPTEGKALKDGTVYLMMQRANNTVEAYVKGEKGAIKTEEGWQGLSDAGEPGGGPGRGRFIGRMLMNYKAPAAQVVEFAEKVANLKKEGDAYVGDFTEEGAKAVLAGPMRRANNAPEISGAKGSLKVWIKDGLISGYEYTVQGTMTFGGNEREINRKVKVEIKDVGNTKFEVPEAAKAKMS
ncbi:MAG: hypothetical protein QHJ82_06835 [Verrucomicrobiota bacterium]|nr:hypothetical protein [Verrucomicrobiota bacterium]